MIDDNSRGKEIDLNYRAAQGRNKAAGLVCACHKRDRQWPLFADAGADVTETGC